jgi:prepilin-type N-terminal cleavage/methylation domain-containing protein
MGSGRGPSQPFPTTHYPLSTTHSRRSRAGFTLVELLVTITIIGMLAALALGGMYRVNISAKQQNSKTTVNKVAVQINEIWESYRTRTLPINVQQMLTLGPVAPYQYQYPNAINWLTYFSGIRNTAGINPATDPINAAPATAAFANNIQIAAIKLAATRELMRLELPCRFADFTSSTSGNPANAQPVTTLLIPQPMNGAAPLANPGGLSEQYRQFFMTHANSFNTQYESAECLYMIIRFASQNELGQKNITDDQRLVGDSDGDGMPEIQDAFNAGTFTPNVGSSYTQHNMPIKFIRWPAGYLSDLQPGPTFAQYGDNLNPPKSWSYTYAYAAARHDIFDPLRVDPRAFALTPLVYSAGPNGSAATTTTFDPYDIWEGTFSATQAAALSDPYYTDNTPGSNSLPIFPIIPNPNPLYLNPGNQYPLPGAVMDRLTVWPSGYVGNGAYADNITNHQLSTSRQ